MLKIDLKVAEGKAALGGLLADAGVYRDRGGHDLTYCAVTGELSSTDERHAPAITFPPLADHTGAMQAVNCILAALLSKASGASSLGAFLEISLCESVLSWQYLCLSAVDNIESTLAGGPVRQHKPLPQTSLLAEVKALFAEKELAYWLDLLSDVDCCFEPVPLLAEVAEHPQLLQRQTLTGSEPNYPGRVIGELVFG